MISKGCEKFQAEQIMQGQTTKPTIVWDYDSVLAGNDPSQDIIQVHAMMAACGLNFR